ncbi:hypothetical protein [Actinoallomurus acaciae]|uniref:DUF937 domain-containing protein n=1 Tax=Actinoallomurus acaciae TaxID=502577 RepID=A0ABV5YRG6_9ACTN
MATAVKEISSIAAKTVVGGGKSALSTGLTMPITSLIDQAFGKQAPGSAEKLKEMAGSAFAGSFAGLFGGSATSAAKALRALSSEGGPASGRLATLAAMLDGDSSHFSQVNSEIGQLIQNGTISPAQLLSAALGARLEAAAKKAVGE